MAQKAQLGASGGSSSSCPSYSWQGQRSLCRETVSLLPWWIFYLDGLAISHVLHNPEPLFYPNPEIFTLALPPLLRTLLCWRESWAPRKGKMGARTDRRLCLRHPLGTLVRPINDICPTLLHLLFLSRGMGMEGERGSGYHSSCSLCIGVFLSLGDGILSSYFSFSGSLTPSPSGPLCSIQMRKKEDLHP